jgi:5-dehydro-2-deoxygluconokinase
MNLDLVCMGRAAVDLYGEQIGARLEDQTSFARYLGGCPANIAVGSARLGLRVAMLTRVGDEQNGRFVRETLAAEGVDVSHVVTDPKRLTALVFLAIKDRATFRGARAGWAKSRSANGRNAARASNPMSGRR